MLAEATEQVMRHRPGFVSANIHASLDGTRVVNYAQWRSREDFQAMLDDPIAQEHMGAARCPRRRGATSLSGGLGSPRIASAAPR